MKEKIEGITESIIDEIKESCRKDIILVNKTINDNLRIPDNVLLYADNLHATKPNPADVDALSEQCQNLEQNVKEVI